MKLKGEQIKSIDQVIKLAETGGSIYVNVWGRPSPASFLIGWQVRLLDQWIKDGRLFTTIDKPNEGFKAIPFKKKVK